MFALSSLSLISFLALARAQSCSHDLTARTQSDLDGISSCTTFNGTITLDQSFSGTADLAGVSTLAGNLTVNNATALTSFMANDLTEIQGIWTMKSLTVLSTLQAAKLTSVTDIEWTTLPALSSLDFGSSIGNASTVVIQDTNLQSLTGISLDHADVINLNNNLYLKTVDLNLQYVSKALTIAFNGMQVAASFPKLVWAFNVTFRDTGSISMPVLGSVNQSMGFINNSLTSLEISNLTKVGGDLAIVSNNQLTNVSMPMLTTIGGGFQIANNTRLLNISGFPAVDTVGGAVDFSGTFKNATLPALTTVKGGFNLQTNQSFNCAPFKQLQSQGVIKGNGYTCSGSLNDPTTKDGSLTSKSGSKSSGSSSSGSSSSASAAASSSKAAAANIAVPATASIGLLSVLAALFM